MKFIFVLILLSALASAEQEDRKKKYQRECAEELNISKDKLNEYDNRKFTDDSQTHCFIKCLLQKYDLYGKDNVLKVDSTSNIISGDKYADIINNEINATIEICNKEANEIKVGDGCERAYRGVMCFIRESEKNQESRRREYKNSLSDKL